MRKQLRRMAPGGAGGTAGEPKAASKRTTKR